MSDGGSSGPRGADARVSPSELASYRRDGFLIKRGLLDPDEVLDGLMAIDHLLCARSRDLAPSTRESVARELHPKITRVAARDRAELGRIYDAARKVLPFWGMLGSRAVSETVRHLLETPFVGVAFRGAGIRFDLPNEDRFRSDWHQEYHSQISSPRGLVAWFSLSAVDMAMGPVQIACGSQREGILPVRALDPMNQRRDYTQTFLIEGATEVAEGYPLVSTETAPGDVVFLDFLLLHRSGWNRSPEGKSRVTCQVRYFDMTEEVGVRNGWVGGWQDGGDFTKLHPEKVIQ